MTMTMITPITIGDSELTSTTAVYLNPEWDVATSYSIGDKVYFGMRSYECQIAVTGGDNPSENPLDGSKNPYWLDIGPSNPWAMFDNQNFTQTSASSPFTVVIEAGRANSVSLFNTTGVTTVRVKVDSVSGGGTIHNETYQLSRMGGVGMSSWLFDRRIVKTNLYVDGWFEYADCVITVTFTGGAPKVGNLVVGVGFLIGETGDGMTITSRDTSTMEIDIDETLYTEGVSYYEVAGQVAVDKMRADTVLQRITTTKGPRVFICSTDYVSSFIYGIPNTFSLSAKKASINPAQFKFTGGT